ncbi:MAG: hypothetical protein K6F92_03765 [Lachnospiraceae bacterium]|nr:hypothetical protein [Lachnospiraceae bacterium]
MANWETLFVKIIKEICDEEGITLTSFDDWAFCLARDGRHKFIYGYQFCLDDAAKVGVLKDKAAAAEMMASAGIKCVPHWCVMNPEAPEFATLSSGWEFMGEKLRQYGSLVVKDNLGTGGRSVYHVKNMKELEQAAAFIFSKAQSLAVSPYVKIDDEYRVIVLDGNPEIVFVKERPSVTGDGVKTLRELLSDRVLSASGREMGDLLGVTATFKDSDLERVPKCGEKVFLKWKHNLGQGSHPRVLSMAEVPAEVLETARKAAGFFELGFSSVDVCIVDNQAMVLEINGGVMMENLAGFSPEYYDMAKSLYKKAILESLQC